MSQIYDFLKDCGVFYVLTINGDRPAGRPFGAVMEHNGDLYLSTGNTKEVYRQIKDCPYVQIIAQKAGTRNWMRVHGTAEECTDTSMKTLMIDACPILTKRYESPDDPLFALFRVKIEDVEYF